MYGIAFPSVWSSTKRRSSSAWFSGLRSIDARPWNVLVFLVVAASTIGYLALANENATAGYELRARERTVATLREETRQLEMATIAAQSLGLLEARIANQGYIPVASVEYLASDRAVVQR